MKKPIIFCLSFVFLLSSCGPKMEETTAHRQDIREAVFGSGYLEAKGAYDLCAQTEGYLNSFSLKEGDLIESGQSLALIENQDAEIQDNANSALLNIARSKNSSSSPELQQALRSSERKKRVYETDSLQYLRFTRLYEQDAASRLELEQAELNFKNAKADYLSSLAYYQQVRFKLEEELISAEKNYAISGVDKEENALIAPLGGRVFSILKEAGDYVKKGEVIARVGDPYVRYAYLNIDESVIRKVQIGQMAEIELNTHPGQVFQGYVSDVLPTFDQNSQSFICYVNIIDTLPLDIVKTQLQCNIIISSEAQALVIPSGFVDFNQTVQVKGEEERRRVEIATSGAEWTHVISGIDESTVLLRIQNQQE